MGAAMTGLRPIGELMFSDFFAVAWDMVANQIAKTRYMTDAQVSLPLVIWTANGAGLRFGAGAHLAARRRVVIAIALSVGAVLLGQLGLWLYARVEGGVLPLLDYLAEVYGS